MHIAAKKTLHRRAVAAGILGLCQSSHTFLSALNDRWWEGKLVNTHTHTHKHANTKRTHTDKQRHTERHRNTQRQTHKYILWGWLFESICLGWFQRETHLSGWLPQQKDRSHPKQTRHPKKGIFQISKQQTTLSCT